MLNSLPMFTPSRALQNLIIRLHLTYLPPPPPPCWVLVDGEILPPDQCWRRSVAVTADPDSSWLSLRTHRGVLIPLHTNLLLPADGKPVTVQIVDADGVPSAGIAGVQALYPWIKQRPLAYRFHFILHE